MINNIINHITFGNGDDVVFLHGFGGSIDSFLGTAKIIAGEDFRVTLPDMPGFGKTEIKEPMTIYGYADCIAALIRYYDMKNITMIGHSFGGRVAIILGAQARQYGIDLKKLVLVDSAGIKQRRGIGYFFKVALYKIARKLKFKTAAKFGSTDYKSLSEIMKKTFINVVNADLTPLLKEIRHSTLIFWGDRDKDTPLYMAKKINRLIKDSGLIVYKDAGHYSYIDKFHEFNSALLYFLKN